LRKSYIRPIAGNRRIVRAVSIRNRTTKLIARRHDLNYFKRMSPLRAWQWWLALAAMAGAVAWFSATTLAHGNAAFTSGPMSSSHAVFGQRCELCHIPVIRATSWTPSFGRRARVPDSACLSCHAASPHHPAETKSTPTCASCHVEHIGAMHLTATADTGCTQCHAQLESRSGVLRVAANVRNFATDHPDFRELPDASAEERSADFALRFNHAEHMHPGLRSPGGVVTLQCQSCHVAAMGGDGRQAFGLAAVSFEKSCRSCHSLDFDTHIQHEAPHASPVEVQAFVKQAIAGFAQANPAVVAAEIHNWQSEPLLPGQMRMPPPQSAQEWIANRVNRAEVILWREKCALCHRDLNRVAQAGGTVGQPGGTTVTPAVSFLDASALPRIEPSRQPSRWFTNAVFSHPAHQAVECAECHAKALTSSSGSDLLMPAIATCRRCHDGSSSPQGPPVKTGHAESGCFLCHVYHGPGPTGLAAAHQVADLLSR
jgi:hypothetical protein